MNKQENSLLTSSQVTFLIFGITMGAYFLKLPYVIIRIAKQDAWISALIGCIYPLYIILVGSYIIKKHPKDTILQLNKKYLGKLLGSILNFIFLIPFFIYTGTVTSDFINISLVYFLAFLDKIKISIITIGISAYAAYKGLKVLGKINETAFYLTICTLSFSFLALKYGSIKNVMPIFKVGIIDILKGSKETAYGFANIELFLLIHPFVKNTNSMKICGLKAVTLTTVIYSWVVFITIFFLGSDIVPKNIYSFIMIAESVQIPIVNNFRAIFMFLWSIVVFKLISTNYYFSTFIINDLTKINREKLCIYIFPIEIFLSLLFLNTSTKQKIMDSLVPISVLFNISFISLIAILIFIKNKSSSR
ncbi:GerAB/ArcD/ProY family transporter [Clostridium lundense]|uniref:GerAB/ArcD/ProY family transporter n=1 Tax=Clostridium lundense TaxID=319475 RepID=UPI0004878912|nr:GerAB/ArcD/ProY family transporter [Clostridium lundense]